MIRKSVFRGEAVPSSAKKQQQSIGTKSFYSNTSSGLHLKNCIIKFSIKMFIENSSEF